MPFAVILSAISGAFCVFTLLFRCLGAISVLRVVARVRFGEKPSWEFKSLTISLIVHGFLSNFEVFILVRVEVCSKPWILQNCLDID